MCRLFFIDKNSSGPIEKKKLLGSQWRLFVIEKSVKIFFYRKKKIIRSVWRLFFYRKKLIASGDFFLQKKSAVASRYFIYKKNSSGPSGDIFQQKQTPQVPVETLFYRKKLLRTIRKLFRIEKISLSPSGDFFP